MTRRQYIAVIAVPLIMIVTIVSILNSGVLPISDELPENIKIEVTYSGSWEGTLYNNDDVQTTSGFTKKTIIVFRPDGDDWTLSFDAEKKDDTMGQLKASIKLIDGTTLEEAKTVEPYGKVSLTIVIE